jgi:hypothetical protein
VKSPIFSGDTLIKLIEKRMKNGILTIPALLSCSTAQAVSMSWSSTITSSASRIEAAQNWLSQLEEKRKI